MKNKTARALMKLSGYLRAMAFRLSPSHDPLDTCRKEKLLNAYGALTADQKDRVLSTALELKKINELTLQVYEHHSRSGKTKHLIETEFGCKILAHMKIMGGLIGDDDLQPDAPHDATKVA